jgi:hypothetical protein
MTQRESIMANHRHLSEETGLITPAGWEVLEQHFALDTPWPYRAVNDFFTSRAEELVTAYDSMSGHEDLKVLGEFFAKLSVPKVVRNRYYTEIDHQAESMPLHIDTDSGHTFHGNFHPLPHSYYEVYDEHSDEQHLYEDAYGEQYRLPINPISKKTIEITNRQLFIISGTGVVAVHAETGQTERTSVPHEAKIPRAINTGRHLLTVYSERSQTPPPTHPSVHEIN